MEKQSLFRRVIFGGFHKEDVMGYVEKLEMENENLKISMKDECDRLQAQITELEGRTAGAGLSDPVKDRELRSLRELLKTAQAAKERAERQLYESEQKKEELKKKIDSLSGNGAFRTLQIERLQKEARQIIAQQRKEAEETFANLKVSVEALVKKNEQKSAVLESHLEKQEFELQEARERLERQAEEMEELREHAAANAEQLAAVRKDLEDAGRELLDKNQQLAEKSEELEMTKSMLAAANEDMDEKERALEAAQEELGLLKQENESLKAELESRMQEWTESFLKREEPAPSAFDMGSKSSAEPEPLVSDDKWKESLGGTSVFSELNSLNDIFAEADRVLNRSEITAQDKISGWQDGSH